MREDRVDMVLNAIINGLVLTAIALVLAALAMQAYNKRLDEKIGYYQGRYGLDRATAVALSANRLHDVCGGHAGRETLTEVR